ncbi:AbrB/MazE/SpoVT family DNA-binding domain-containing protein [bacterium]|nr:AbrB/MazE/SpoVT family DNA-binding domain-containing protein [bacterium]
MRARIVKIGNSQGIRIPKLLLEQSGLCDEVELEVQNHNLIIKPRCGVREGWDIAFCTMAENGDDQLLDKDYLTNQSSWDEADWEW